MTAEELKKALEACKEDLRQMGKELAEIVLTYDLSPRKWRKFLRQYAERQEQIEFADLIVSTFVAPKFGFAECQRSGDA